MELLKKILEQDTVQKFRVPSKSEPGKFHIVRILIDGSFSCDCEAWSFHRECSHIRKAKEKWQKRLLKD